MKNLLRARVLPTNQMVGLATLVNLAFLLLSMPASAAPIRIVAFGDSLTAGHMLPLAASFPAQLTKALAARGHEVEIADAGVSGDTTAAGLERLDWSIPDGTEAVILALGANDALRGLNPGETRNNLDAIIGKLKSRGIDVLLAGMVAPRGLGADYVSRFDPIYADLAEKHGVLLYPFFLDGIAERPELNLEDGMHPNPKGVATIVERILPKAEELIARVKERRAHAQRSSN
jgi:acyl-CoA thioesterase-1